MVAVLHRRISPDEARFGVAASTTSTLLIVVWRSQYSIVGIKIPH